ncbi:hypothetical protein PLESTB_000173600 [Pleodorina starrii]|uniref:Uncharacterized protein n=1 Tax=Pleodorina starrii TaxID=330485 RepID=A0A9W6EY19_9CHLO|nr:hypothetical protein PLESTB_000173600 [Pleodorina starrii]
MDALPNFAYAPPSGKLEKRLEQMAELGGFDFSPVRIVSMASFALLLGTGSSGSGDLEVCEDGGAVRVAPNRAAQPGHRGSLQEADSPDSGKELLLYRFSRAMSGGTPGAALFIAEAPLRAWLLDGYHTSLVCFAIPAAPVPPGPAAASSSPAPAPASPSGSLRFSMDEAPGGTASAASLPATLDLLMGLERSSVLLECLHAAFSGPAAGESGLALWCLELRCGDASGSTGANGSGRINSSVQSSSGGGGASARRPTAGRTGSGAGNDAGGDGAGGWHDLMAEAVTEAVAKASLGVPAAAAAAVGGAHSARANVSAGSGGGGGGAGRPFRSMSSLPNTYGSVAAVPAEGPVHAASVAEAIAALHAAFCRSSLWRRRGPIAAAAAAASTGSDGGGSRNSGGGGGTSFAAAGRQGPLLEPAVSPDGPAAAQLFVRLGVRLQPTPPPSEQQQRQQPSQGRGASARGLVSSSSSYGNRREAPTDRVWTTLDLVFVGCDPPPPPPPRSASSAPAAAAALPPSRRQPPEDVDVDAGDGALGPARELLVELLSRQGSDAGLPRPLHCTSRPRGSALCRRLAPLLAGNVAPHLLLALPIGLPGAAHTETDPAGRSHVLEAVKLVSQARAIRTVVTKSEPPPPLYGVNAVCSGGGRAPSASSLPEPLAAASPQERDRQVASLLRLRHSQEMKDLVKLYKREAARRAAAAAATATTPAAAARAAELTPLEALALQEAADSNLRPATATATDAEFGDPASARGGIGSGVAALRYSATSDRILASPAAAAATAAAKSPEWRPTTRLLGDPPWSVSPPPAATAALRPASSGGGGGRGRAGGVDVDVATAPSASASATAAAGTSGWTDRDRGSQRQPIAERSSRDAAFMQASYKTETAAARASSASAGGSFSGGGGRARSSGAAAAAAVPAVVGRGYTEGSGRGGGASGWEAEGSGGVLVGGMVRLQRRLEALQNARRLREAEAAPPPPSPGAGAAAGRYHGPGLELRPSASQGGASGGTGGEDSESCRSGSLGAGGSASGSATCLYGSVSSGGGASGSAAAAAAAAGPPPPPPPHQAAGAWMPAEVGISRSQFSADFFLQSLMSGGERSLQSQQPQQQQRQSSNEGQRAAAAAAATAAAQGLPQAPVDLQPADGAAAAAAAERLSRLRSDFDRLYQGLVSEVVQDAAATATGLGASGHVLASPLAAVMPPPLPPAAAPPQQQLQQQQLQPTYNQREPEGAASPSAWAGQARPQPAAAAAADRTPDRRRRDGVSASAGGASAGAGADGKPSRLPYDAAGDPRRASVGNARRPSSTASSSFRRSSEVAWAALPHQGPAAGLYGALLAGYAVQELPPPATAAAAAPAPSLAAGASVVGAGGAAGGRGTAGGSRRTASEYDVDGGGGGGGYRDGSQGIGSDGRGAGGLLCDGFGSDGGGSGDGGGGADSVRAPSVSDWRPGERDVVGRSREEAAGTVHAVGGGGGGGGGSGCSPNSPSRGLERLLDSTSSSSSGGDETSQAHAVAQADVTRTAAAAAAADQESTTGFVDTEWSLGAPSGRDDGGLLADGPGNDAKAWPWPSGGGGEAAADSGGGGGKGSVSVTGRRSGSGPGDGPDDDNASLGSWNDRIARDAAAAAAALASPPPPPPLPLLSAAAAAAAGASPRTATAAGSPFESAPSLLRPGTPAAASSPPGHVGGGGGAAAAAGTGSRGGSGGGAVGFGSSSQSGGGAASGSPKTPAGPFATTAAAVGGGGAAGSFRAPAALQPPPTTPGSNSVPLRQRNQALLGALERAAAGSEALHDRLYDSQLELMEVRAAMEVQQASHDAEVARLRRHLRRAAATAAAEEDDAGGGAEPGAAAGWSGSGGGAAAAALAALVGAYEEDIEGLQRQVSDLVAGQYEIAVRCAEQELAALASDAVRSRRRRQHAVSSGGGGAVAAAAAAAAAAASRQTTPRLRESVPALGRGGSSSSCSPQLQPRSRSQYQPSQLQPQRSARGRGGLPDARRRRHSCGPVLGGAGRASSSPYGSGAAAAAAVAARRSSGKLAAGTDGPVMRISEVVAATASGSESVWSYGDDDDDDDEDVEGGGGARDAFGALGDELAAAAAEGEAQAAWRRGRREMGALRSALRQANRREAHLRSALAAAAQQRRAALLEARVAAGEGVRRRWLETQNAELASQLAAARSAASAAAAEREAAARDAARLRAENSVLAGQTEELRRLTEAYAVRLRLMQMEAVAAAGAVGAGRGFGLAQHLGFADEPDLAVDLAQEWLGAAVT